MMPGLALHRVARSLCSADMRERVIDALLADCQHEWLGAANWAGRVLALARCQVSFWMALAGCLAYDVRHDIVGFTRRVAPLAWVGFWAAIVFIELSRNITLMSAYMPALTIALYRMKRSERRSWAGLAWSLLLMVAFLAARELVSEYRFILGWAAGACVSASWTFLVRKEPSVVEAPHRD